MTKNVLSKKCKHGVLTNLEDCPRCKVGAAKVLKKMKVKKVNKKLMDGMYLRLDGEISIVDVVKGKEDVQPLDGKMMLKVMMKIISEGLLLLEDKHGR